MHREMVLYEKRESVGMITLKQANLRNAFNAQMVEELADIRDEICWDNDIRVVVITGEGKDAFSIRTDEKDFSSSETRARLTECLSTASIVDTFDCPMIGAINGDAIGQGLELILACDIRIALETSRFGLPHIKAGLIPWDGGTQRLSRLVGRAIALEMILTGEMVDAKEAYRMGLISKILPSGELMTVVMDMAKEMASKGPIALKYAKEAIYKGMDMTLEQGLRMEADLYLLLHTTKDRMEGIKAFREKRAPRFEGR